MNRPGVPLRRGGGPPPLPAAGLGGRPRAHAEGRDRSRAPRPPPGRRPPSERKSRPRPTRRPGEGEGRPRAGGWGESARESRRQRETRGGRKRACAPPPASGEAEPQHSRPSRRGSSGGSKRRRRDHAPDGPASRGSSEGRSPAAAAADRDAPGGGGGKGGTGAGERNADRPPPLPPSLLRSAARPLGFRPLPLPQRPGWSRRLAAAWLRGMVLSGGQSPGARRCRRRRPRGAPLPSLPRTGVPSGPGPLPAFTRTPARGSFVLFVATAAAAGTVCELRRPPPPCALREPGPGAARGHRPWEAEAVRAYLSPVRPRPGVEATPQAAPGRARLAAAPAAAAAAAAAAVGVSGAAAAAAGLFLSGYVKPGRSQPRRASQTSADHVRPRSNSAACGACGAAVVRPERAGDSPCAGSGAAGPLPLGDICGPSGP
ncbi:PREDICTED: basic salivary proline-rich protein 4-like [Elephantulus edwardii]|uniref:basic salivary proline-rich protein 4-like n=1 Tax=Elephantulus edwardii TaxID=28737 RepID=UPI0003F0ED35|nr:PREDICTED: basic salivary proline-rich protein 4-like [Elephantulus edwardii]